MMRPVCRDNKVYSILVSIAVLHLTLKTTNLIAQESEDSKDHRVISSVPRGRMLIRDHTRHKNVVDVCLD